MGAIVRIAVIIYLVQAAAGFAKADTQSGVTVSDIMSKRTPATFKQHHYEGDAHHSQDRERKTGADGVADVGKNPRAIRPRVSGHKIRSA